MAAADIARERRITTLQDIGSEIKDILKELETPREERINYARAIAIIIYDEDENAVYDEPTDRLIGSDTESIEALKKLVLESQEYIEGIRSEHTDTDEETINLVINNSTFKDLFSTKEYLALKRHLGLTVHENVERVSGGRRKRNTRKHRGKKRKQTKRRKPRKSARKPKRRVKKRKQTKRRRRR